MGGGEKNGSKAADGKYLVTTGYQVLEDFHPLTYLLPSRLLKDSQ